CHVYVDEAFAAETGRASALEASMLDFAANVQPTSRLACPIRVTDDLDGLIVRLPESQH
ncbi:MAG: 2Fe-2S ferredoxin, partial [bacterium]